MVTVKSIVWLTFFFLFFFIRNVFYGERVPKRSVLRQRIWGKELALKEVEEEIVMVFY